LEKIKISQDQEKRLDRLIEDIDSELTTELDPFWSTSINKILIINKVDECFDPVKLKDLVNCLSHN